MFSNINFASVLTAFIWILKVFLICSISLLSPKFSLVAFSVAYFYLSKSSFILFSLAF